MKIISNNSTFVMQIYDFIKSFFYAFFPFFIFYAENINHRNWKQWICSNGALLGVKFQLMLYHLINNNFFCSSSLFTVFIQLLLLLYALCLPIHFELLKYWNNFISAMPSYHRSQRNCQYSILYWVRFSQSIGP